MSEPTATPDTDVRIARRLIDDLDGIAWEADAASMSFTHVSGGVRPLLGHDAAEWLADDAFWGDRLHPDDRARQVERFVRIASAGGRFDEEYRLRRRDGAWAWVRDLGHALTDAAGRVTAVRGLIVDISERKAAEVSLRESGERFRRVVDHLSAIVYLEAFGDPVGGNAASGSTLYVSPRSRRSSASPPRSGSRTRRCGRDRSIPTTARACARATSGSNATVVTCRWSTGCTRAPARSAGSATRPP